MHITCLHTLSANIPAFEAACPPGMTLAHHVRSDLRYRARAGITEGLLSETSAHLKRLSAGSDVVLVTCDVLSAATQPPALTADALLAQEVNARGKGKIVDVFYSWPGSETHLAALFDPLDRPAEVRLRCIEGLWDSLNQQDVATHDALVRKAVKTSKADLIALANPMMTAAAGDDRRVLGISQAAINRLQKLPAARA